MKRFATYSYKGTKCKLLGFTRNNSLIPTRVWVETLQGKRVEIDRIKFESEAEYLFYKAPKKPKRRPVNKGMSKKVEVYRFGKYIKTFETVIEALEYTEIKRSAYDKLLRNQGVSRTGYSFKTHKKHLYECYILDELIDTTTSKLSATEILNCSMATLNKMIESGEHNGRKCIVV